MRLNLAVVVLVTFIPARPLIAGPDAGTSDSDELTAADSQGLALGWRVAAEPPGTERKITLAEQAERWLDEHPKANVEVRTLLQIAVMQTYANEGGPENNERVLRLIERMENSRTMNTTSWANKAEILRRRGNFKSALTILEEHVLTPEVLEKIRASTGDAGPPGDGGDGAKAQASGFFEEGHLPADTRSFSMSIMISSLSALKRFDEAIAFAELLMKLEPNEIRSYEAAVDAEMQRSTPKFQNGAPGQNEVLERIQIWIKRGDEIAPFAPGWLKSKLNFYALAKNPPMVSVTYAVAQEKASSTIGKEYELVIMATEKLTSDEETRKKTIAAIDQIGGCMTELCGVYHKALVPFAEGKLGASDDAVLRANRALEWRTKYAQAKKEGNPERLREALASWSHDFPGSAELSSAYSATSPSRREVYKQALLLLAYLFGALGVALGGVAWIFYRWPRSFVAFASMLGMRSRAVRAIARKRRRTPLDTVIIVEHALATSDAALTPRLETPLLIEAFWGGLRSPALNELLTQRALESATFFDDHGLDLALVMLPHSPHRPELVARLVPWLWRTKQRFDDFTRSLSLAYLALSGADIRLPRAMSLLEVESACLAAAAGGDPSYLIIAGATAFRRAGYAEAADAWSRASPEHRPLLRPVVERAAAEALKNPAASADQLGAMARVCRAVELHALALRFRHAETQKPGRRGGQELVEQATATPTIELAALVLELSGVPITSATPNLPERCFIAGVAGGPMEIWPLMVACVSDLVAEQASDLLRVADAMQSEADPRFTTKNLVVVTSAPLPQESLDLLVTYAINRGLKAVVLGRDLFEEAIAGNVLDAVTAIQRQALTSDPFQCTLPVERSEFFGRAGELETLADALERFSPTFLCGINRVGKTSLARQVLSMRMGWGATAMLNLQTFSVREERSFYRDLSLQIRSGLAARYPTVAESGFLTDGRDDPISTFCGDIRRWFGTPSVQACIVIDEVDVIVPTWDGQRTVVEFDRFVHAIRGLAMEFNKQIRLMMISAEPRMTDGAFWTHGQSNPFHNFLMQHFLTGMKARECEVMLRRLGVPVGLRFDDGALQDLFSWSGGFPFLIREFASHVRKQMVGLGGGTVTAPFLQDERARWSKTREILHPIFKKLSKPEQALLSRTKQGLFPGPQSDAERDDVVHLTKLGLLTADPKGYQVSPPALREVI